MEHSMISFRNTSQYSAGGPSACGLASVNAVRTVLMSHSSSRSIRSVLNQEETAMSIMAICQYWNSNEHLDVHDILNLPLFKCQLETVEVEDNQSTLGNFRKLTRSLSRGGACAAVVTRSPEIVSVISIPAQGDDNGFIVIFDSHPRPKHPLGAAFLIFYSPDDAATYLSNLFQVDASIMRDNNWQTQMLSRYSAHILQARSFSEEEGKKAVYDANISLLKLSVAIKEASTKEEEVQLNLSKLRQELERQREARHQAASAEADANRKLQALRKELADAREFAESLSDIGPFQAPKPVGQPQPPVYSPSGGQSNRQAVDNQPKPTFSGSEAEEYERVRLAGLAAKAAEQRQKWQSEQQIIKQEAQAEAERRDAEAARLEFARQQAKREIELRDLQLAAELQREEESIVVQHARLLDMEDTGFNCDICSEHWSIGMMSKVDSCGHAICRECMVGYVKSQLDERRWPVVCPLCRAESTKGAKHGEITREVCENAGADEDLITKWRDIELASVSVTVECPTCKKVFPIVTEDYNETEMLWCPHQDCEAYWCKTCSQLGERGQKHTCDGQAEFDRYRDSQKDVRSCPGCKTYIVRNTGCRHMTCIAPGCNTHFCDSCGENIIKSQDRTAIDAALQDHYRRCSLFDGY
ncbi:hypothetical protein M408DRAFT_65506 [Serendipita vermifera MAFF 305830]|uniref:RING-type domain-containing protein n=1 Tax=Serendipita vermifera MAFF 305830 TaxID=933852 RepID=A0A0C3BHS0_SERVB|nr:hypothetical protein M408DRAFT_65506 [Serendipita vermifera MAFF 305830]